MSTIKYRCSDGSRVSQAVIDRRKTETYRRLYTGGEVCAGCGCPAEGTAHIVPQKVCKDYGITEYCWMEINMVPSCHHCNSIIESYKSEEFEKLFCRDYVIEITRQILPERYEAIQSWRQGNSC